MVNKSGDPIAFWQQIVGEMQKSFSVFTRLRPMGSTTRPSSDDPATGSGNGQKPMADLMENYFAGMNMPSRAQLTALNERLASIESALAETRAQLSEVLAAAKVPPPALTPAVDVAPQLGEMKALLNELLAASKSVPPPPRPAVDVSPQLSEIKALLNQVVNVAKAPDPAPAIEAELREIGAALDTLRKPVDAAPKPTEAAPKAVEPPL